ncbi:hypothetical protein TeGR_g4230, partial [Tetraparma gracilis]
MPTATQMASMYEALPRIWEKQGVRDWIGYDKYVDKLGKDKVVEIV